MEGEKTKPKPRFPKDYEQDPNTLAAKRYGTKEMGEKLGAEQTFADILKVQGVSSLVLSEMHPDIVPEEDANEIVEKASLDYIDPNRIRELEEKTGHDVIAVNTSLEEVLKPKARPHVNRLKTSADSTQPAKALQFKAALEEIADSTENLRDISAEKSIEWIDIPFMDQSHLYDALPTVAGRPLAHYVEMLQSGLDFLKFIYNFSIMGKWADATGNHHQATASGVDGMKLQEEFCKKLGVGWMDAPAQLPGLEFESDIVYSVARIGMTVNNLAKYVALGFGNDMDVFIDRNPKKRKGSSAMPHKDIKGGNRITEEQDVSMANKLMGWMTTSLANCEMPYARVLYASSNSRIDVEDNFKFADHCIRRLALVMHYLDIDRERSKERIMRTYDVTTSSRVMAHLTDYRKVTDPMSRSEAHNLMGKLATEAYKTKTPFYEVLMRNSEVTDRIDPDTLKDLTDSMTYIGQSKEIIRKVYDKCHGKKTFG
jgi:adenylosuccinate lyase